LTALPVVKAPLSRRQNLDTESELGPLLLAFEIGVLPPLLAPDPGNVARVEHKPPVALGNEASFGLLQMCLLNGFGHR
jgi:hypothetical protein